MPSEIPCVIILISDTVGAYERKPDVDRIEKGLEEFFRGMAELRESQKKTDAVRSVRFKSET